MANTEDPSLWKEIGKLAWILFKAAAGVCGLAAVTILPLRNRPTLGLILFYCIGLAGLVIYMGWQSYNDKKANLKRQREWEAQTHATHRERMARLERLNPRQ